MGYEVLQNPDSSPGKSELEESSSPSSFSLSCSALSLPGTRCSLASCSSRKSLVQDPLTTKAHNVSARPMQTLDTNSRAALSGWAVGAKNMSGAGRSCQSSPTQSPIDTNHSPGMRQMQNAGARQTFPGKRPESELSSLCGPRRLCCTYSTLRLWHKSNHRPHRCCRVLTKLFTKLARGPELAAPRHIGSS